MVQCSKTLIQESGCRTSGCASPMDRHHPSIDDHPCYSETAHHRFARIHLPVAPACNIQCHYCNRKYDCANESRPGVVSQVLKPEQAVKKALVVGAALPQLAVVGVAGPGDPLASPKRTLATFQRLAEQAPDLKLCLSTNGLGVLDHIDALLRYNITHVTLTINCLDPEIGAAIYPWILWRGKRIHGRTASEILIERQQRGLEQLIARGILVKVNSVLIPGVNDTHLPTVSQVIRAKGAFIHNIMPLIAEPEHGTYYGLTGQRGPTPEELKAVQAACAGDMRLMRHCQQCRADAVGTLDEDRRAEFELDRVESMTLTPELLEAARARRAAFRAQVDAEQHLFRRLRESRPRSGPHRPILMAVTAHKGRISGHFGQASEFLIYEVDESGIRMVGLRQTGRSCQGEAACGESADTLEPIIRALDGCEVVLCAKIGHAPWQLLVAAGIQPNSEHPGEPIEQACRAVWHEMQWRGPGTRSATVSKVA